jgi:hypothetical protein
MFNVPKNTIVSGVSYKNTFEFVKYVKLYSNLKFLSYKLKSKVKIAVLSLDAQNHGIVYAGDYKRVVT